MPARKVAKKTAKKGVTLDADLTSIAVPFGLLLAKQSLEKLSGTKVKAKKGKNVVKNTKAKTAKRMKRVAIGGSNANAANTANVANAANAANTANVPGVNTMAPKTGANVGGKSVKKGRGRPRSRVGGNNVSGVTNSTLGYGNVSGGRGRKSIKSKKSGKTTPKKTRKTQKGGGDQQEIYQKIDIIAQDILKTINFSNNAASNNTAIETAIETVTKSLVNNSDDKKFMITHKDDIKNKVKELRAAQAQAQAKAAATNSTSNSTSSTANNTAAANTTTATAANTTAANTTAAGGKSKAKRGRGRPRKN